MVSFQYHIDELPVLQTAGDQRRPAALWLRSEWLSTHALERPQMAEKKWRPLLGYLLEERLLQPPESLHFAVAATGAEQLWVHVLAREKVDQLLRAAAIAGLHATVLVPDFYALAWDGATAQLAIDDGRWLARLGEHQGLAGSREQVEPLLIEWLAQHPAASVVVANPAAVALAEPLSQRAQHSQATINWQFAPLPAVNLLQGSYRPEPSEKLTKQLFNYLPLLLWGALALVAVMVAATIGDSVQRRDVADLNRYRDYLAAQLLPTSERPTDQQLRAEVQRYTTALQHAAAVRQAPRYPLVAQLSSLLSASGGSLQSLKWHDSEMTLVLKADSASAAALRRGLATLPGAQLLALELQPQGEGALLTTTLRWEQTR
ncbi:hypothetical protein E3W66_09420 [Gammaproteobacteria bacterium LSUCC0057]|uniref:GspL cytoplasmic actin-ATPase-like domain-containing protein n=1 Tax=Gammaproteobacteria bacterium LSUCC0057 TaxID=2559237 RepID=A0A4Y8UHL8_9GAMM|nr:hypothetical protein E3W66_09420 [Gammaproteobacteria bacterium LSUCC0057]